MLAAGEHEIPERTKASFSPPPAYLLINRVHRERVVTIDSVADLDAIGAAAETPGPDRTVIARDTLRRLYAALEDLPPRCREAIVLRRIEGLSRKEIAQRDGHQRKNRRSPHHHGRGRTADLFFGECHGAETMSAEINAVAAQWIERRDRDDWKDADQAELETWLAQAPAPPRRILAPRSRLGRYQPPHRLPPRAAPPARAPVSTCRCSKPWAALFLIAPAVRPPQTYMLAPDWKTYSTTVGGREILTLGDAHGSNSTPIPGARVAERA